MIKIVNVKKIVIRLVVLVLLLLLFLCGFGIVKSIYSCKNIDYKTIYVTRGDTLWKIASEEQHKNSYYKNKDIRDIICDIKRINNLKISKLNIGQELKIPIN